eukprot:g30948.t1
MMLGEVLRFEALLFNFLPNSQVSTFRTSSLFPTDDFGINVNHVSQLFTLAQGDVLQPFCEIPDPMFKEAMHHSGFDVNCCKIVFMIPGPEVDYEVVHLQFAGGVIVTLEEAQDGHVTQGVGGGVETVRDWKALSFVAYRVQMLYKAVSEHPLGLTDVEEATPGAADAVDHIGGCAGVPLSNVE